MPYIVQDKRAAIDSAIRDIVPGTMSAGEMNYTLTRFMEEYRAAHGDSYETFRTIMDSFDLAAREYYRRVVGPYEDKKAAENGDVYAAIG